MRKGILAGLALNAAAISLACALAVFWPLSKRKAAARAVVAGSNLSAISSVSSRPSSSASPARTGLRTI